MNIWYIKLHRSSQDNILYFAEPFTKWQAWQDMILIANHKKGALVVRWNIIDLNRGQLWHSEDTLAERRKRSRGKVRRFLEYLETIQQIVQHKSKVKSVITIINYDKYQWNDTTDGTTDGHQTVQQTDTNKNDNNKKEWKERKKKDVVFYDTVESYYQNITEWWYIDKAMPSVDHKRIKERIEDMLLIIKTKWYKLPEVPKAHFKDRNKNKETWVLVYKKDPIKEKEERKRKQDAERWQ